MLPNELIILGGGPSVVKGIKLGLFEKLPSMFALGLNYSYKYVDTTAHLAIDETFYKDNYEDVLRMPLYIGKDHFSLKNPGINTLFLPWYLKYNRNLIPGIYNNTLAGLFALSLFVYLMPPGSTIYLLGYDYGPARDTEGKIIMFEGLPLTHWYQASFKQRGTGRINWYTGTEIDYEVTGKRITNAEREFRPFMGEKDVKIIIVGESNIPTFPKISYQEFFSKASTETHNQVNLRTELRAQIIALQKQYKGISLDLKYVRRSSITDIANKKESWHEQ